MRITKRNLIVLTLIASFAFLFSGVALAKNGPHVGGTVSGSVSGGFAQDTDACAGCHRAHTGTVDKLLKEGENRYEFCTSCHNGTGANANVNLGRFEGIDTSYQGRNSKVDGVPGKGLNGGGFIQAAEYTGIEGRTNFANVTSRHNLVGLDSGSPWTAWGGGTTGYGNDGSGNPASDPVTGGGKLSLECTNCHDPHGTLNSDGTERYRILQNNVQRYDQPGAVNPVKVAVGPVESNEPAYPGVKNYTKEQLKRGITGFCSACHTQYKSSSSQFNANDVDSSGNPKGYVKRFRHAVDKALSAGAARTGNGLNMSTNLNNHTVLALQQTPQSDTATESDTMTCLTCHQAHGTRSTMSTSANVSPANSSTLLRLNNRGVCQDCHQK